MPCVCLLWQMYGLNFNKACKRQICGCKIIKIADKAAFWFKFICADWLVFRAQTCLKFTSNFTQAQTFE